MRKKILSVIVILSLSYLVGCQNGTSTVNPTPTVEPTATLVPTVEPTATSTPTLMVEPVVTSTPVPTEVVEPTAEPTPTEIVEATSTPVPTNTPTPEPTATPEPTSTSVPTATPEPTATSTPTPTPEPTSTPIPEPTATSTSTPVPTSTPTPKPTATPTPQPVKGHNIAKKSVEEIKKAVQDYVFTWDEVYNADYVTSVGQTFDGYEWYNGKFEYKTVQVDDVTIRYVDKPMELLYYFDMGNGIIDYAQVVFYNPRIYCMRTPDDENWNMSLEYEYEVLNADSKVYTDSPDSANFYFNVVTLDNVADAVEMKTCRSLPSNGEVDVEMHGKNRGNYNHTVFTNRVKSGEYTIYVLPVIVAGIDNHN